MYICCLIQSCLIQSRLIQNGILNLITSSPVETVTPSSTPDASSINRVIWTGWAFGLGSTIAGGMVTPMARSVIVDGMAPSTLLLVRLGLTTVLLVTTLALAAPHKLRITMRGLWLMAIVGVLAGVEICTYFWSLSYVDAATTSILKSVQPLVVLVLLVFGGERMTSRHWSRLGLSMVGIYLLVGLGGKVDPFGVFLICLSLIFYALQLALVQWWLKSYDTWTTAFYLTAFTTLVITIWWTSQGAPWVAPTMHEWLIIVVLAVVGTYFARLALFAAITRIGSGQIALLWPLQTLISIVLAVIFLQERLSAIQWFGGVLVLAGAFLAMPGVQLRWPRRLKVVQPPV